MYQIPQSSQDNQLSVLVVSPLMQYIFWLNPSIYVICIVTLASEIMNCIASAVLSL